MVSNLFEAKMAAGQRFAARVARWPAVAFLAAASSFYTVSFTRNWWNDLTERLGLTANALDDSDLIENDKKQRPWWKRLLWQNVQEETVVPADVLNKILKKDEFSNQFQNGIVIRFDTNQYSANTPIEDRHVECHFPSSNSMMFGVFDGHSGYYCSETLKNRMPQYLSTALSKAAHISDAAILEDVSNYTVLGTEHSDNPVFEMPASLASKQAKLGSGPLEFSKHLQSIQTEFTQNDAIKLAFNTLDEDICNEAIPDGMGDNSLLVGLAGACAVVSVIQGDDLYIANTGKFDV